jgi:hypothetical protein
MHSVTSFSANCSQRGTIIATIGRRFQIRFTKRKVMFQHIKDLQFDARVSGPDPRFARILLDQFGGGNGELKAAIRTFTTRCGS